MGTTGLLATTAGFFGGMFCTAATLWFNERKSRRALEQVTERLRENDARVHSLLREARDIIAIVGSDDTVKYLSPAADRALGRSSARLIGTNPTSWVHPEDRERLAALLGTRAGSDGELGQIEFRVPHESGAWITLEAASTNMLDDPAVDGIVLTCRDITERKRSEAELREAQERFRSAFDYAPIGMALTSLEGRYFRVNRALSHMLGRADDELAGAAIVTLTHPADRKASQDAMRRLVEGEVPGYRLEQRFVHSDGRPVWVSVSVSLVRDAEGTPLYTVSQIEDITERRASGERLAHQAIHDPLTGLPNRTFFVDRLRRALNDSDSPGQVAVLFIDLDHFKVVNDSLGHPAGDRLIVAIADRLRTATRPSDIVARFGGDEFTVLCTGVPDESTARELSDRVSVAVAKPVALAEGEVFVTASIGIALSGGEMETPETLLRNADAAMYRAKDQGRARSAAYESGAHDRAVQHLRTGNDLHRALERGELRLHYQPIVRLDTGSLSGFEALVRWQHPQRGLVGPGEFVELAEETGLVVPLGFWVFGEACRQAAEWHDNGAMVTMSVNLSPRQLAEPTLTDDIARILEESGVHPDAIWLEITENTLMSDAEAAATALASLRTLGVHLSVDDFGTGYSSMSYLKRFPVEALKVDRSFVDGIGREPEDTAICTAVVSLARALGVRSIAEGVETPDQMAELRALGCDLGQGYLFGRPQLAEEHGDRPDEKVYDIVLSATNGAATPPKLELSPMTEPERIAITNGRPPGERHGSPALAERRTPREEAAPAEREERGAVFTFDAIAREEHTARHARPGAPDRQESHDPHDAPALSQRPKRPQPELAPLLLAPDAPPSESKGAGGASGRPRRVARSGNGNGTRAERHAMLEAERGIEPEAEPGT
jgi:diguanylate cyclase (GGDEF)-like protein/PAS domain S-box-containing protein